MRKATSSTVAGSGFGCCKLSGNRVFALVSRFSTLPATSSVPKPRPKTALDRTTSLRRNSMSSRMVMFNQNVAASQPSCLPARE